MIFTDHPQSGSQYFSIGDAIDKLTAFNAVFEASINGSSQNCKNPDDAAAWRKLVYEGVINCGGEPMELDFFEQIFGGKTEFVDAKKLYFRYNCDMDKNIVAANNVTGAAPGAATTFQLHKAKHSGDGKYSMPSQGESLYIYEDRQSVVITNVDKTTDYAHLVTVVPNNPTYTVNIRKDRKILVLPGRLVGGLDSHKPSTQFQSPGYSTHVRPFRIRKDWSVAIDLEKGYEEILQWAIMFDDNGREVDTWEAYEKTKTRSDMKWLKNLLFFLGQRVTNPTLLGAPGTGLSIDYSGFDGYFNTMHFGGGTVMDFDANVGFDLDADFGAIILRNDALKRTNEFVVLHGKPFKLAMQRNAGEMFKRGSGACTFESFKRIGEGDIKKLGVDSFEYAGFSLHFKEVSALSDTRGLGNFEFPHIGMFIPGNGLRDSKGKEVPAMQFFCPRGKKETGSLEEFQWDNRKIKGEETLGGYLSETVWSVTHCPHQHILANPVFSV